MPVTSGFLGKGINAVLSPVAYVAPDLVSHLLFPPAEYDEDEDSEEIDLGHAGNDFIVVLTVGDMEGSDEFDPPAIAVQLEDSPDSESWAALEPISMEGFSPADFTGDVPNRSAHLLFRTEHRYVRASLAITGADPVASLSVVLLANAES